MEVVNNTSESPTKDVDSLTSKDVDFDAEFASTATFEALERDFQEVLTELAGEQSLDKFRIEYEKIHRALKKSHEQEKRLIKKCRELNTEIVNNAAKVQTALKLAEEDKNTMNILKNDAVAAWNLADACSEKETKAKETIAQLKEEITNLSKLVEKGAGLSVGQENMVKELKKAKDELQRESEDQQARAVILESQLESVGIQKEKLELQVQSLKESTKSLQGSIAKRDQELERSQRKHEGLEKKLRDLKGKLDKKVQDHETMGIEVEKAHTQISHLEKQLNEARATMEKYLRDYDQLYNRTQKLTDDLEEQMVRSAQLAVERNDLEKDCKSRREETARVLTERTQFERKFEREHRAVLKYRQMVEDAKTPLVMAQSEIDALKKEIELYRKRENDFKKSIELLKREREVQGRATQGAELKTKVAEDNVREQERISYSLETELSHVKEEVARQRKQIYYLEKEREKLGLEAADQRKEYLSSLEETKLRDMRIHELQKKSNDWEAKLKQQQSLYESVRSDRNVYSKNLIEAQDEIAEMKRKFKIMNHQIEQLKEEISAKDQALVKEHFDFKEVEKQREQMRNEISKMKHLLKTNDETIHQQDGEIRRLTAMVRKMDEEALTQRKEYDQVINERDILGTQLIRRNDELALLYEKMKIQQSTLRKGEVQYTARLQDIRILRLKCLDLHRELVIIRNSSSQLEELKREVFQLQRDLLQEKTKVKALSEELENPMNIHRWRKLEGSDPATYEMIQKIQTLQKRLIAKTEEVVEKDLVIQEKDKLYLELKNILARQPGPEVSEQLNVYQSSLREKTRQMKSMASELNMLQAQVNEYKYEIERLSRELQETKRKYYEQKRNEQFARDLDHEETFGGYGKSQMQQQILSAKAATTRYTGGGFAIK